ncbi:MAG: hypothetical protein LUQ50_05970 [Methanospirillum sp.]|uniref:hypothetical protein n=1 Tax=Methanospirillum sp. TaxID=45200 RepID=UPI00237071AD|nr:hypothetical protein [Methanospirillum sp.]MDD1728599.1 hypothetical protein [Methanospirillum sp.]
MMTEPQDKKKSRFIADEEDIEIIGNKMPDQQQVKNADRVFGKILKDKKNKNDLT